MSERQGQAGKEDLLLSSLRQHAASEGTKLLECKPGLQDIYIDR